MKTEFLLLTGLALVASVPLGADPTIRANPVSLPADDLGHGNTSSLTDLRPTVYPYLLDLSLYPDYLRRPSRAPTWATSEGRPHFVGLRTLPGSCCVDQGLGTVCTPGIDIIRNPKLRPSLDAFKRHRVEKDLPGAPPATATFRAAREPGLPSSSRQRQGMTGKFLQRR
jgi:hypothetical protein